MRIHGQVYFRVEPPFVHQSIVLFPFPALGWDRP
jgi:hypothetical protein